MFKCANPLLNFYLHFKEIPILKFATVQSGRLTLSFPKGCYVLCDSESQGVCMLYFRYSIMNHCFSQNITASFPMFSLFIALAIEQNRNILVKLLDTVFSITLVFFFMETEFNVSNFSF